MAYVSKKIKSNPFQPPLITVKVFFQRGRKHDMRPKSKCDDEKPLDKSGRAGLKWCSFCCLAIFPPNLSG
jgi:hypothetical protein